jgi:N4-gp56 family major capsid protein
MADTKAAAGLTPQQWDDQYFTEYLTSNRFAGEMGTGINTIIQVKENLTKKKGDRITFALVNRLKNDAITGTATMEGNEEDMDSRDFEVTIQKRRNAVRVAEQEEQFSAISLRNAGRDVLMTWSQEDTEQLIIRALSSINGVRYSSASEANKDAWLVDNADRVLFGALRSNNSSNDHSASLANCDTTADKFNAAAVSKMKTIAETVANPLIRPVRSTASKGRRYYVCYVHPYLFNDLKADTTITQAQREVQLQMENERLFEGGDLYWDGVIIKQIEKKNRDGSHEWDFGLVGASSARVCGAFLCGAQSLGMAWARRWRTKTEEFDYGDKHGVETSALYGIEKMRFEDGLQDSGDWKDHGVVSGYFATAGLA